MTLIDELAQVDWRSWPEERKQQLLYKLRYDWSVWARPEQRFPDSDCDVWLYLAGRGTGKTRSAAEEARKRARVPGTRIAVVGPTHGVIRDVCIEGMSGILAITPKHEVKRYNRSTGQVWLKNGSAYFPYSSTEPDRLRGPEHHFAWVEEFAAHRYPQETWDMLVMGLRLGDHPQAAITTTPRPIPVLKNIINDGRTIVTRGRTLDNAANLPPAFLRYIMRKYANTTLGRQELEGLLLEDVEGALWNRAWIDRDRTSRIVNLSEDGVTNLYTLPDMRTTVVGVDPAVTSGEDADETGIVVVGVDYADRLWVLDDMSMKGTPAQWAKQVLRAYKRYDCDAVIAERNQGGDLVEETLKRAWKWMPVYTVWASKGKDARAQPIAYLYERGMVSHVGSFPTLEDQMCTWVPGERGMSPDRMDALVWGMTYITAQSYGGGIAVPSGHLPTGLGYHR